MDTSYNDDERFTGNQEIRAFDRFLDYLNNRIKSNYWHNEGYASLEQLKKPLDFDNQGFVAFTVVMFFFSFFYFIHWFFTRKVKYQTNNAVTDARNFRRATWFSMFFLFAINGMLLGRVANMTLEYMNPLIIFTEEYAWIENSRGLAICFLVTISFYLAQLMYYLDIPMNVKYTYSKNTMCGMLWLLAWSAVFGFKYPAFIATNYMALHMFVSILARY